jgi:hypothetical protein
MQASVTRAGRGLCRRIGALASICMGLALIGTPTSAQQKSVANGGNAAEAPKPAFALAVRAEPQAPNIDGDLSDEVWQLAPPITDFTQRDPNEGEPASEPTEARVLFTDKAIFVAIRAWDSSPGEISAQLTRRDEDSPSDWVGIGIDSYHDRRTAYFFLVNPAGVKQDVYLFDDTNEDDSWDAVWQVATQRDEHGWTAEFRIPFSQLKFSQAERHTFGFNVYRRINRLNEEQYWRLPPKSESGVVSKFGELEGIEGIDPPRRLEITPYTAATAELVPAQPGNPFQDGRNGSMSLGGDLYYGLTSNLTLSATVNPDFGQVEADPAIVNLSAFETFFPEQRPFFNEGLDVFRFGIGVGDGDGSAESLFYTRRIGRAPQGQADPRGGYVDPVNQTTIYTAAKIAGKTPSGWTTGFTGALTAEERASVVDSLGARHSDVVEPATGYAVGTIARDFRDGLTKVGLFGTATVRSLPDNLDMLRSQAYAVATNWSHRFGDDRYSFSGWFGGSHVTGSEDAIALTQRSSARYYQRPDNNYVTYDPTRTSLTGYAGQLSIGKHAGNWRFSGGIDTRSPGYEVNDLGFQRDADRTIQWSWLSRRWLQPGKVFRRFQVNLNQWSEFNYGWDNTGFGGNLNVNFTLKNYWGGFFGANRQLGALSTGALRGGPAILRPAGFNTWIGFFSDERKPIRLFANGWIYTEDESDGRAYGVSTTISWRAASNLFLSVSPNMNKQHDAWQYLSTDEALGQTQYMFGQLAQTTVASTFRGNLTFTPTLSLQLYWEPFVSSGNYVAYERVIDPRADHFYDRFEVFADEQVLEDDGDIAIDIDGNGEADVALGNPNFTYLSFRSNAVLRWEYRPGSTLFLVWQHGRTGFSDTGEFNLGQGVSDLVNAESANMFVVKFTYWLGR